MTMEAIRCRDFVERVTEYMEEAQPPEGRAAMEAHLAECEACTRYLAQMGQTVAWVGRLPLPKVEVAAREALARRLRGR